MGCHTSFKGTAFPQAKNDEPFPTFSINWEGREIERGRRAIIVIILYKFCTQLQNQNSSLPQVLKKKQKKIDEQNFCGLIYWVISLYCQYLLLFPTHSLTHTHTPLSHLHTPYICLFLSHKHTSKPWASSLTFSFPFLQLIWNKMIHQKKIIFNRSQYVQR